MIGVVLVLVVIGVVMYLIQQSEIHPTMKVIIQLFITICVLFYLMRVLDIHDIPVPRLR